MKTKVTAKNAPAASGPFSHAVRANGLIFTSGQIGLTKEGKLLAGTLKDQIHQIMKNLQAVLKAADVTFADVVKTTIYVTDMSVYGDINEVYGSYFKDPFPAREVICVKALPLGATVEISLVAVDPSDTCCGGDCCDQCK
ncbi:hypothetical protein A2W24_00235 [Microgenomates group bacterium RBG_16_45_19]|nr:MAG: hypothetical protein A2W24_00235 [Microgenomates group bacterium RBG_16_45_19]